MMAEKKQVKNSYDQVFDFIFGVQKTKVNKPFAKPSPDNGGDYLSALVEIGTQPTIYPLESSLNTINGYIAKATEIDLGAGVKAGLGSGVLSNPNAYVNKEVSKARARENFASIGGYLQHGIDGALVSLFMKNNGATGKTSAGAGMLFSDISKLKDAKIKKTGQLYGLEYKDDWVRAEENVYRRSMDLLAASIAKSDPRLSKDMLLNTISMGQRIDNREDRLKQTVERLKLGGLKDPREGLKIAERLWGNGLKGDQGVYRSQKDYVGEILRDVPFEDKKVKSQNDSKIRSLVNAYNSSEAEETEKRKQKNQLYKTLKNDYNLSKEEAFLTTTRLIQAPQQNTSLGVAEDALYSALVGELMQEAVQSGDYEKIAMAKRAVKGIFNRPKDYRTLGIRVARARLFYNWAKDTEGLTSKLLNGEWESFGNDDLNFTQIVKPEKVYDENGKEVGQYMVPARSVMGSLIGNFYYLHPRNFIKGVFLDGDLLLKWASKWDPAKGRMVVDKKSTAYLLYQARLGNVLSYYKKPFTILSNKITAILNPLANSLKKLVKNFLIKLLGATGVGGMIVNLLMKIFGDQVAKVVAQITIVVMLGLLGILMILADATTGVFYSENLAEVYLQQQSPTSIEIEYEGDTQNIFTENDFQIID